MSQSKNKMTKEKMNDEWKKMNEIKTRTINKILIIALVFIIISSASIMLNASLTSALGITPGRTTLTFEPGMHQEIHVKVVNNEYKNIRIALFATDELAQYVTLNQSEMIFREDEGEKEFTYTINLPSKIEKPGLHEARIIALEMPEEQVGEESGITPKVTSRIGVVSQLYVNVPYPNAYLDGTLEISEAASINEDTTFILALQNLGLKDTNARTEIEIVKDGKVIDKLDLDEVRIESGRRVELVKSWKASEIGAYLARVTVHYTGEPVRIEKEFESKGAEIVLRRIYVNDYNAGDITKVIIVVDNQWNEKLTNVYGDLIVTKDNGDVLSEFKSAAMDLEPGTGEGINAYWDSSGLNIGDYNGKIIMHYGDKSFEKQLKIKKTSDDIAFEIIGITAEAVSETKSKKFNMTTLLIIAIVGLVVANIAWFVYFKTIKPRRARKKEHEKKK